MAQPIHLPTCGRTLVACLIVSLAGLMVTHSTQSWAQEAAAQPAPAQPETLTQSDQATAMTSAIQELQQQVAELREAVAEMRSESAEFRKQAAELRDQLRTAQMQTSDCEPRDGFVASQTCKRTLQNSGGAASGALPASVASPSPENQQSAASLEDDVELLKAKVDDQYQTKVESASKYKVRLSGIALLNLFSNRGATDNQDFPSFALPSATGASNSNFGATLRQSEIGLEVFGPTLAGAKVSASVEADFAGGFPSTSNGVNSGYFRLRTASARMDWQNTSVVAGQDDLFFSPLSPTSFASLAVPALSYSGNLWGWIPQVRIEHRLALSDSESIKIQAGILDNLTGEYPSSTFWSRTPGPGEESGQPAYAVRTSWTTEILGHPLTLAAAGYYGRQYWGFERHVDGWAGITDWTVPLLSRIELSGEFYRGRAIGALGGGLGQSVYYTGNPQIPYTAVYGLDSAGGWSQLKYKATRKLEFNSAFGIDSPRGSEVRAAFGPQPYLEANRSWFGNLIFRPRSDILFSAEYRRSRTDERYGLATAGQVNLVVGVLF